MEMEIMEMEARDYLLVEKGGRGEEVVKERGLIVMDQRGGAGGGGASEVEVDDRNRR